MSPTEPFKRRVLAPVDAAIEEIRMAVMDAEDPTEWWVAELVNEKVITKALGLAEYRCFMAQRSLEASVYNQVRDEMEKVVS